MSVELTWVALPEICYLSLEGNGLLLACCVSEDRLVCELDIVRVNG